MSGKLDRLVLGVSAAAVAAVLVGAWWVTSRERARATERSPEAPAESLPAAPVTKPAQADEPGGAVVPITTADSVLAIWEHPGAVLGADGTVILVAWPDGRLIWSADHVFGGAPYRTGRIDPKKLGALVDRFERDGVFADKRLEKDGVVGIHSWYLTILIRFGKHQFKMESGHEGWEEGGWHVEDGLGVRSLNGRRRLEILRNESKPDWLFYRFVWSETKGRLIDLIPAESTPTDGKPFMKDGELYWREPQAPAKQEGK
jgi:hypothetical protein